jgi:UDP-N-acetylmuramyl pentapeptide phosphotransferase/UDP-N-acetylglucosamine-1-phosphate transferase
MIDNFYFYLFGAFFASFMLQYLVIDLSYKRGIFIDDNISDLPQKFHTAPTPRIGGLGIFIGCFFLMVNTQIGLFLMLASVPAFVSGFLEDLFAKISPGRRLIIMLVSAVMAIYLLGVVVTDFTFFEVPLEIGVVITIVAIIGMINGTNLIDGINGLSSGISMIIFITYFFMARIVGDMDIQFISAICFTTLLGFFVFNYPKGKIFLGDGGAYFIGFMLAVVAILLNKNSIEAETGISPWFILCTLIHPVYEVIFSFFRKAVIEKESPFNPDPYHIHQFVFIYLAKKNNPLTTLIILPFVLINNLVAIQFYNNHIVLLLLALSYVLLYSLIYYLLYKKHQKTIKSGDHAMTRKGGLIDKNPTEGESE